MNSEQPDEGIRHFLISKINRLMGIIRPAFTRLDEMSGGRLGMLSTAISQYQLNHSHVAAASIAFYTVFSIFPLIGVAVWALGHILDEQAVVALLIRTFSPLIPFSSGLISQNIERLASSQGAFGLVGMVGLVWSASNVFAILSHYINAAWEMARVRSLFYRRMVGVGIVIGIIGLLIISILLLSFLDLVMQLSIPLLGATVQPSESIWSSIFSVLQPVLLFGIFFLVFRWLPNVPVRFREAFWPALVVTGLWEVTAAIFNAYLKSGWANYDLLYGSLGAMVTLMIWFYINSAILLFGAHLSAAIAQEDLRRKELELQHPTQAPAIGQDG